MKTYFDYTETERGMMTYEQVENLTAFALMEAGVVRVTQPKLPDYPNLAPQTTILYAIEHPDVSWYRWSNGGRAISDLLFLTREDAVSAMRGLTSIKTSETLNEMPVVSPANDLKVVEIVVVGKGEAERLRPATEKKTEMKKAYDKQVEEYEKFCKKSRDACSGIWEDWHNLQNEKHTAGRVINTRAEYIQTCEGNVEMADKFLSKAFTDDELKLRDKWAEAMVDNNWKSDLDGKDYIRPTQSDIPF